MQYLEITFQILWIIIFVIFTVLYFISLANSIFYKVPQVSTFNSDFKVMKKWLWKYNLKWKSIADLWSGRWKTLRFFEKEFKMKTTWFEIDLSNVLVAKFFNKIFWYKAKIIRWNYLKKDLSKFDVIYVYLFPILMENIETKLWKNCKEWTLIISNAFKFKKHSPIEILLDENKKEEVYIYKI